MRSTPDITPHLGSLLKFRHDLHANPELRYEEHRTGDKVAAYLSALGLTSSGTASNAAGVITYCMKNNYLNADKAAQVKNQLLGKMGLGQKEEPKDEGYLSGLSGMVTGSGGKSFSLDKVKGDLKEKACDYVLDNARSLL